jgi:excisionase family DNA binding protein
MTLKEAAQRLGLTPDTLRQQIAAGKLRARKHGRDWWVETAEVKRYGMQNLRPPRDHIEARAHLATGGSPTMPDTPDFSTRGLERMRRRMTSDLGKKPASVLDADRLREAARNVGLPREVTVADIEDLAAEYDRLLAEPHDA